LSLASHVPEVQTLLLIAARRASWGLFPSRAVSHQKTWKDGLPWSGGKGEHGK